MDDDDTDESSLDLTSVDLSGQAVGNRLQTVDPQIKVPEVPSEPERHLSPASKSKTEDSREKVQETPTASSAAVEVSPGDAGALTGAASGALTGAAGAPTGADKHQHDKKQRAKNLQANAVPGSTTLRMIVDDELARSHQHVTQRIMLNGSSPN